MAIKYAVVDAFTELEFKGNPAAVCLLEKDRDEEWLKSMAAEFNMPVTCFLTRITNSDLPNTHFKLRWFSPTTEVEICGHATLAAAHFCFTSGLVNEDIIKFSTLSGDLTACKVSKPQTPDDGTKKSFLIELDFPAISSTNYLKTNEASSVSKALGGVSVVDIKITRLNDLLVILPSAKALIDLQPQFEDIRQHPYRGFIVSAPAPPESEYDFFSRFFYSNLGVNEDSVCGSAHCAASLYWHKKLGKCDFLAYSASSRSGLMKVHVDEEIGRIKLQGKAVTVMNGYIIV